MVQLYDGHGGKFAARHCVAQLVPMIEKAFFEKAENKMYVDDRVGLSKQVGKDGFHEHFDKAVISAFESLDGEIKRHDPSGTTAAVVFLKKGVDNGDVHVKCAWCGDSRVILTRDFDWQRTMDLSDDHKPSSPSEVFRIRQHYENLHGDASFKTRDEVLATPEASVRGGNGKAGVLGNQSGSKGNSREGSSRGTSRGNSMRGNSRHGPGLGPQNGLPPIEMTLGHATRMEETVWGAVGDDEEELATVATVTTKTSRLRVTSQAVVESTLHESTSINVSHEDLTQLREIANRSPSGDGIFDTFDDIGAVNSFHGHTRSASSETFNDMPPSRDASVSSFAGMDGSPRGDSLPQFPPSRESSAKSVQAEHAQGVAFAKATALAERIAAGEDATDDEGELGEMRNGGNADDSPSFDRAAVSRMSFIGYYKTEEGKPLSNPRIYSSTGESHGVSRSIGDRGSARACVATPEIRTIVVPTGSGARIMACSDGVWDSFTSQKAARKIARFITPEGAAKRMCVYAREKAEYSGQYADDITAVVLDVGVNEKANAEPGCVACVVM